MAWHTFNFLFLLVSTMNNINAQLVSCTGSECSCPKTPPTPGALCILDCGTEDICKGQDLHCRKGDPCEILCEAKASCSAGVRIYSNGATDVTIICSSHDACKDDMEIICGVRHCQLQCDERTSCENWGFIDVSLSKSFLCIGSCPNNIPSTKTVLPSISPTNPTINPTAAPTGPTLSPTVKPTQSPTNNPTPSPSYNPTNIPTSFPTNHPTPSPTNNPTQITNSPTLSPTNNPTSSPSYNPTNNPTVTPTNLPSAETLNPTEYPTFKLTENPFKSPTKTQMLLLPTLYPTLNPSLNPSESSSESVSTSTIEPNLTVTFSESDTNLIRTHSSHTNNLNSMSTILIVLAVAFGIITAILGWLLCSKNKQSKHKNLKVDMPGHKNELSSCPSKSPSTYAKSIKSVYSTNDRRLSSVQEKGSDNEGSSHASSSSDDMYTNNTEQGGGFPVTGQNSISMVLPPIHRNDRMASNSGYIYGRPQPYHYTVQPYVHNMIYKSPSLHSGGSVDVAYSYNYNYNHIPGMQTIVSPISPPPDLASISRGNENVNENADILPVIPGQKTMTYNMTDRDDDNDSNALSEYSQATVTSNAASNVSSAAKNDNDNDKYMEFKLKKNANDENLEKVVCIDLDESKLIELAQDIDKSMNSSLTDIDTSAIKEYNDMNTNKLYAE